MSISQIGGASSSLAFRSISMTEAKGSLSSHYLGNNVPGIRFVYGDGEAVAVFSVPRSKFLFREYRQSGLDVVELARLWSPDIYTGVLSRFISQCIGVLRKEGIDLIYSLADPYVGHTGTIYKACNFVSLGISAIPGNPEYILDGKRKHPRWFYYHLGTADRKVVKAAFGDRVQILPRTGKLRYAYPVTRFGKKCLLEWVVKHPPGK